MSFLEITTDLRETNSKLERIACALEQLLLQAYGIRIGHTTQPADDPNPRERSTIGYETDEAAANRALTSFVKRAQAPDEDEPEAYNDVQKPLLGG